MSTNYLENASFKTDTTGFPEKVRRAMGFKDIEYVSDKEGQLKSVIVPIAVWQDIVSELETRHLLQSDTMKKRLLEAQARQEGLDLKEAIKNLGLNEAY